MYKVGGAGVMRQVRSNCTENILKSERMKFHNPIEKKWGVCGGVRNNPEGLLNTNYKRKLEELELFAHVGRKNNQLRSGL